MTRGDWVGLLDIYMMIFWCVTYIECIRIGIKQKTYCMPLLALCMNFCWEVLSFVDYVINDGTEIYMYVLYGTWALLDAGIVLTYLMYGRSELIIPWQSKSPDKNRILRLFIIYSLGTFLLVLCIIVLMYKYLDNWKAYFVFPNNLIMSALFVLLPFLRKGSRGQSMSIAIPKCIGTLCATMTMVFANMEMWILIIGALCCVLDVVYIILLNKAIRSTKPSAFRMIKA